MTKIKDLRAKVRAAQQRMADNTANAEEFNKAEREFKEASAELQEAVLERMANNAEGTPTESRETQFLALVREARQGGPRDFVMQRTITKSGTGNANMNAAGLPITIGEIIEPMELGTIYDKVGIRIVTGVRGQLVWPCLTTTAEVTVAGEAVALGNTDFDFSKITATPQRVGISVEVSNEALNDASFDLEGLVIRQIQAALGRVINKAVIGSTAVGALSGPFAGTNAKRGSVAFAATYPTYTELLKMKGVVAGTGAQMEGFAYVMNATTYAALEATPITSGDSRMIIEDGKIAGYPVFVTDSAKIADGAVNAGCFAYTALNQHGDIQFVIDPYTGAKKNVTTFTLNADFSLTVLAYEAYCVGKKTT